MSQGGILTVIFDATHWDSTISFQSGIDVSLGGLLELDFAADVDVASQLGRTFDVFDWTGVKPVNRFQITSHYQWDLSRLYDSGVVTLVAVPEPSTAVLLLVCGLAVASTATTRACRRNRRTASPPMELIAKTRSNHAALAA